jgi:hypothetical protein
MLGGGTQLYSRRRGALRVRGTGGNRDDHSGEQCIRGVEWHSGHDSLKRTHRADRVEE